MEIDVNDFREAVEDAGGEWYGEYSGRNFFEGYAATFDNPARLIALGYALAEFDLGELADATPHMDNLGRRILVAWSKDLFAAE